MKDELYKSIKDYIPFNEQEISDKKLILEFMDKFDNLFSRENQFGHFTTSAWIVNSTKTKVLMVYHNIYNSWSFVGGHADSCFDLLKVIRKEIFEETGVKNIKLLYNGIYSISINPVVPHIKNGKYVSSHLHFDIEYLFEASDREALKIKEAENSDVKWIDINKVLDIVSEVHMKPLYLKLIKKLEYIDS